ncbi:host cell division inhibitor Icd-like protein [Escherichia coli]|nr:host cell division inhibitor Icd-like protein [Escherichia coli]
MNTGYAPVQGRGFVRPGETEKTQNWCFSGIKKAAPKWSRLSEQLTCGAICACKPNHKPENDSRYMAGGQCDQPGGLLLVAFLRRGYCVTKSSRANFSGGINCGFGLVFRIFSSSARSRSLVSSCFCRMISLTGVFSPFSDDDVCSFIVLPCKAMRRSTSHHGADSFYPLGSMPRRFSSVRPNSLSQLARLMPSLCASLSNCSFSSGEIRILNCGDCPSPLGLLSRLIVDKWSPIELAFLLLGGHLNTRALKKAKPEGARNTNGLLTTNDSNSIEVAMRNHTTHPQGRDSHNLNKYIWRFIALSTAQPRVITIEATSEQEARQQSPTGCVMVFTARILQGEIL